MNWQTNYRTYSRYYKKIGPLFKKPRVKAYTMLILSFFTISFFGFFAIKPTLKTIAHLKKEIADSLEVNAALERKISQISQAKEEYQKIEDSLPLITKALPSDPQLPLFIKDLENLVQEAEATISSMKVAEVELSKKEFESSTTIPCSLSIEGTYLADKKFLDRLFSTSRLYTIESFEIFSKPKEAVWVVKLDLRIKTYYFPKHF